MHEESLPAIYWMTSSGWVGTYWRHSKMISTGMLAGASKMVIQVLRGMRTRRGGSYGGRGCIALRAEGLCATSDLGECNKMQKSRLKVPQKECRKITSVRL